MSPVLKQKGGQMFLYVPVELSVADVHTIQERVADREKFLAVAVPSGDCMAVGVVFEDLKTVSSTQFFYGGKEAKAYRNRVVRRIQKSLESRGTGDILVNQGLQERQAD